MCGEALWNPGRRLRALFLMAGLLPGAGRAQVLEDWRMLHTAKSFDYLVTERGFGVPDSTNPTVFRVTASRMLVRYVDEARTRMEAERAAAGLRVAGYERFASTTWLLDISCRDRTIVVIETTDWDDDGHVLDRIRPTPRARDAIGDWEPRATRALLDWTCSHRPVAKRVSSDRAPPVASDQPLSVGPVDVRSGSGSSSRKKAASSARPPRPDFR